MISFLNPDHLYHFIVKIKTVGSLDVTKMWSGSRKTYILNHSCMEFSPEDELLENPFCFSIPLCYFNFLDDVTGEIFDTFSLG